MLTHNWSWRISTVFWVLAGLIAMAFSTLIPPMQSPDENSHIARAYLISRGQLLLQDLPLNFPNTVQSQEMASFLERARQRGGRMGGMVDNGLLKFTDINMGLAGKPDKRLSSSEELQLLQIRWVNTSGFNLMPGTGYYFPAIYAPQVLALATGQMLDLSIKHSYLLARAMTLSACLLILWLACRLVAPNPAVLALLLIPMSLFQILSPTIDGLTTCLSVLTLGLFMRSTDPQQRHCASASWGLIASIFLLTTSRTHLLPLLLLPFIVAWQRHCRRDFYLGCALGAAVVAWTIFALQTTTDVRIVRVHSTTELLLQYANDPASFVKVVWASLTNREIFDFYQRSFIGVLGWLDSPMQGYFYPSLWAGLGICFVLSVAGARLPQDWHIRLLLALLSLTSMGLIFLALLVTWTPHPSLVVQGVQGRYFVVPMILLGFAVSGFPAAQTRKRRWLSGLAIAGFAALSLTALTVTLLSRYH
jgi:uncharacterized membrane protein